MLSIVQWISQHHSNTERLERSIQHILAMEQNEKIMQKKNISTYRFCQNDGNIKTVFSK